MDEMPLLETARLLIRPFGMKDLKEAHRLFDQQIQAEALHIEKTGTLQERREWLEWTGLNYRQLAKLNQPPYGDRAIVLKESGQFAGSCGYVPCLAPFEQLASLGHRLPGSRPEKFSAEVGLFYAISPAQRRLGYASEAAEALIRYGFHVLRLKRIVATTDYDNEASISVMRKLGMRIEMNPLPEPGWMQVVGVVENPE